MFSLNYTPSRRQRTSDMKSAWSHQKD